ncbi:MAG: hypothetical protein NC238_07635 [Dehalobacter sp.]|nr:hypothetical protein [Dehalobacter sp.]
MSNQVILWSMIILPWFTLFFMRKEDIKRLMPVGLFAVLTSIIVVEAGQTLGWFVYGETAYPLKTPSYIFGLNIITTIWLLYFTYGRFWTYLAIDIVLNFGFIYLFHVYFLGSRGIFYEVGITPLQNVLYATIHGILTYGYQVWQEGALKQAERTRTHMQPVLAKPLTKDQGSPREDDQ